MSEIDTTAEHIKDEYLRDVYRAAVLVDGEDGVDRLKTVVSEMPSRRLAGYEQAFLTACQAHILAVKRHKLFKDTIPGDFALALVAFKESLEKATVDLLGTDLIYKWDVEVEPEIPQRRYQRFSGGRPTGPVEKVMPGRHTSDTVVLERVAPKPYLYILMRNDIGSMNPGKAVAQGTHAANQMVFEAVSDFALRNFALLNLDAMLDVWQTEAKGFGTCICLGATERQMRSAVRSAQNAGLHAGITHDPSYPVKDGDTFYTIPMDTCAYIFDYQAVVRPHVDGLELLP